MCAGQRPRVSGADLDGGRELGYPHRQQTRQRPRRPRAPARSPRRPPRRWTAPDAGQGDRRGAVDRGAVTQLSAHVAAPGSHGAIASQYEGVTAAAVDGHDTGEALHRHRCRAIGAGPIAQPAIGVHAARAKRPIGGECNCVVLAHRHGNGRQAGWVLMAALERGSNFLL